MWYVILTITGKEQELTNVIQRVISREKYDNCFVFYQECFLRKNGGLERVMELLFPSYVFVETEHPEEFFVELKKAPGTAHFLGVNEGFWGIYEEEELFLRRLAEESFDRVSEENLHGELMEGWSGTSKTRLAERKERGSAHAYVIRPSFVWVDEEGRILGAEGVLKFYMDKIVKQRLRKRSVVIEIPFCGNMRRIRLGIRLETDG